MEGLPVLINCCQNNKYSANVDARKIITVIFKYFDRKDILKCFIALKDEDNDIQLKTTKDSVKSQIRFLNRLNEMDILSKEDVRKNLEVMKTFVLSKYDAETDKLIEDKNDLNTTKNEKSLDQLSLEINQLVDSIS